MRESEIRLTRLENDLLYQIALASPVPVCRFELQKTGANQKSTALSHVWFDQLDETLPARLILEHTKRLSKLLRRLEKKNVISITYFPEQIADTRVTESKLFGYFAVSVEEGKKQAAFIYDVAAAVPGKVSLTEDGAILLLGARHPKPL